MCLSDSSVLLPLLSVCSQLESQCVSLVLSYFVGPSSRLHYVLFCFPCLISQTVFSCVPRVFPLCPDSLFCIYVCVPFCHSHHLPHPLAVCSGHSVFHSFVISEFLPSFSFAFWMQHQNCVFEFSSACESCIPAWHSVMTFLARGMKKQMLYALQISVSQQLFTLRQLFLV